MVVGVELQDTSLFFWCMLVKDAGEMTIVSVQEIRNRSTAIINPQPLHNIFPTAGQVDGSEFSSAIHDIVDKLTLKFGWCL